MTAATTLTRWQLAVIATVVAVSAFLAWRDLLGYLVGAVSVVTAVYALFMVLKAALSLGTLQLGPIAVTPDEMSSVEDANLPVYTVLVPLYHEAEMVPGLIANLRRLDYPLSLLQIILLCEEDDTETLEVAWQVASPRPFEVVVVPPSLPRTKPKACNVGLARAQGQFLVVYDAEDCPEPDQLKKAVAAFGRCRWPVVCLQARLEYRSATTNPLTRLFAAEYAAFFDHLLPSLARLRLPVPLGGTSNHFRMAALRMLGGWDPYNVTEDLDLGIRIARRGWLVEILDSITWEEPNSRIGNWLRQRSRWMKGHMQTYLVHMRSPWRLWRDLGTASFGAFQLLVGGVPLTILLNPVLWGLTAAYVATRSSMIRELFPPPVYMAGMVSMVFGNFAFAYAMIVGALKARMTGGAKWMLLAPFYWALMSLAAWKALVQLIARPHYWEKTQHGLLEEVGHNEPAPTGQWRPRVVPGGLGRHLPVDDPQPESAGDQRRIPAAGD